MSCDLTIIPLSYQVSKSISLGDISQIAPPLRKFVYMNASHNAKHNKQICLRDVPLSCMVRVTLGP